MIVNLKNKNIKIEIPEKVERFKPEVFQQLINDGFFTDSDKISEKFRLAGPIDIPENRTLHSVQTIGIWCSGGADSSLLLYLLTKKIIDEQLPIKIQPYSVRRGRPWNPMYAEDVVEFVKDNFDTDVVNDLIIYYPDINDEYQREIKEFRDRDIENFIQNNIQIMFSGITCNPPHDDNTISKNKERTRDENSDRPIVNSSGFAYYINPFFDINKKHVREIYDKYELTDTLFPITRSCEGADKDTDNYTYHCGKCWWCEERIWAFGKLQ